MTDAHLRRVSRLMEAARPAGRAVVVIEALPGAFATAGDGFYGGLDTGPLARLVLPLP
jgi:hypothetical protein